MKQSLESLLNNKTVTLLGAGISNLSFAEYISPLVKSLSMRDKKSLTELEKAAEITAKIGGKLISGKDYLSNLSEDIIIRSPGIRPDLEELVEAQKNGSYLTSEMELFLSHTPCPVYALTGSDGKTTTSTLVALILESGGKSVFLGGNIGNPLLYRIPEMTPASTAVVELSSFQLITMDEKIDVAGITNISPNHLDWHRDMDEYIEAKKRILKKCRRAVLNYDDVTTRKIAYELKAKDQDVTLFSLEALPSQIRNEFHSAVWIEDGMIYAEFRGKSPRKIMNTSDILLPGKHNVANYLAAISMTLEDVKPEHVKEVARSFGGVEHRLELVGKHSGVSYINSSIDSSPTRTAAALGALHGKPTVLIAGGYDKNIPYEPLANAIFSSSVHTVILTGDTADVIRESLIHHHSYNEKTAEGFKIILNTSFDGAFEDAVRAASPGDIVLLSPASASFDTFRNFEERGNHFKDLVNNLK